MQRYPEFALKLKARASNRYKDLVKRPIKEHKRATYEQLIRLHPHERELTSLINDQGGGKSDDEFLLDDKQRDIHDPETQLRKIKKLEAKFGVVYDLVKDIYAKHDKLLEDISG